MNTSVKFKTWMLNVEGVVHARGKASKEARWSDKYKKGLQLNRNTSCHGSFFGLELFKRSVKAEPELFETTYNSLSLNLSFSYLCLSFSLSVDIWWFSLSKSLHLSLWVLSWFCFFLDFDVFLLMDFDDLVFWFIYFCLVGFLWMIEKQQTV